MSKNLEEEVWYKYWSEEVNSVAESQGVDIDLIQPKMKDIIWNAILENDTLWGDINDSIRCELEPYMPED